MVAQPLRFVTPVVLCLERVGSRAQLRAAVEGRWAGPAPGQEAALLLTSPQIDLIDGKGRGVIATKQFSRGEFVVEYHGDLIEITDAKKREALYAQDPSTGCYMYYFQYLSKTYW